MDETSEAIRHQMDETKLQLAEKLESLEQQVSDTVQSTGTAVTATAEAVQETVQSVTGAVRHAVQSVSNALDIRRQIEGHPWLVIGGCVALGYLAVGVLKGTPKKIQTLSPTLAPPTRKVNNSDTPVDHIENVAAVTTSTLPSAFTSGQDSSTWHQLRDAAVGVLIVAVQDIATRVVPLILDQLSSLPATDSTQSLEMTAESRSQPMRNWSPEADQRLHVATSGKVRSSNSYSQGALP